jgi:hypothetical protein
MLNLATSVDTDQLINFPQTFTNHFKKYLDPSKEELLFRESGYSCYRCGGRDTKIETRQTRAADERMDMFVYCRSCKSKIHINRYEPETPYELCILMENQTEKAIKIIMEVCFQGLLADLASIVTNYVADHIATVDCKQLIYSPDAQRQIQQFIQNVDQMKQCRNIVCWYKRSGLFSNLWCDSEANLIVYIVYSKATRNKNSFLTSNARVSPTCPVDLSEPSSADCVVCAPYYSLFDRIGALNLNLHALCQRNQEKHFRTTLV